MTDVLERINARLDAMEAAARRATDFPFSVRGTPGGATGGAFEIVPDDPDSERTDYHLAVDPAAVLAMVAGLRAVVALHVAPSAGMPGGVYDPQCSHEGYGLAEVDECETLRLIAAMFDPPHETGPEGGR